ncbi:MAG: DUF6174 domain-containing protein [Ignavibacteriaceae bacterium]
MIRSFILLLLLLGCTSCKKESVSEVLPQTPYESWRSQNLHNYSIDQVRTCFCPDGGVVVRLTVKSDLIFSITKVSDGSLVTSPYYYTVDSLFGIINNPKGDSLVIKYNAKYGFPEYLDINPQQHPVDGGVLIESSNLQELK